LIRHRFRILLAALCLPALISVAAFGADRLPANVKTSASPAMFAAQIQSLIDSTAAGLASDDPITQQNARLNLINECQNHTGAPASPQYQAVYATGVNKALLQLLKDKGGKNVRLRVNAGVSAADVASRVFHDGGDASKLAPMVQELLADKQTAVALWGIKAAKPVIASTIENAGNPTSISKLIVKIMPVHGGSGAVVEEAYSTLTLERLTDRLKLNPALNFDQAIVAIVPDLLDLIAWRAEQYQNGNPPSPQAERVVPVFLSSTAGAGLALNPALSNRALKVMGDLVCGSVKAVSNGNSSGELIDMIKDEGKYFDVTGDKLANPAIKAAGRAISDINERTDPNKMQARCDDLLAALKSVGVKDTDNAPGAAQTPSPVAGAPK
jgi:hypothetical protein